jgi:exopolysaccharide production protein ExoQ
MKPALGPRMRAASRTGVNPAAALARLEEVFAVAALCFLSGGILPLLAQGTGSDGGSDPIAFLVQNLVALATLVLLALRWRTAAYLIGTNYGVWLLGALALLSPLWSDVPGLTLRRAIVAVTTGLFGLYLAVRFPVRRQLEILGWTLLLLQLLSVAAALLLPAYGVMHETHAGAWRGVFVQKNTLGRIASLGIVVFMLLAVDHRGWWRRIYLGGLLAAVGLVLMSTSKTGMLIAGLVCGLYAAGVLLRARRELAVVATGVLTVVMVTAGYALVAYSDRIFMLLGRDATLTGRTIVWYQGLAALERQPWLGYGYAAFWRGRNSPSSVLVRVADWDVSNAHNGFLDLALELGLIGLAVFMLSWVFGLYRALHSLRITNSAAGLWPFTYLTFLIAWNVTESTLFRQNTIFWALYVAALSSTLLIQRAQADEERRHGGVAKAVRGRVPRSHPTGV